jgi:hypothetical protein
LQEELLLVHGGFIPMQPPQAMLAIFQAMFIVLEVINPPMKS